MEFVRSIPSPRLLLAVLSDRLLLLELVRVKPVRVLLFALFEVRMLEFDKLIEIPFIVF